MIMNEIGDHAATLNSLAAEGKIDPIRFIDPDGVEHEAVCISAAHDYLKKNGYFQPGQAPIVWIFKKD